MTEAEYAEYVREVVAQAPEPTDEQLARIAAILRPFVTAPVPQAPAANERRAAA